MYQVLRSVINAGFKAVGYSGVRSTPVIQVSSALHKYKLLAKVCYANKRVDLTKHDRDVHKKEGQVD